IAKTVNGHTTYSLYANEGLIAELNAQGQLTRAYGWQPDTPYGTAPLWQAEISGTQWQVHVLQTDHLGTPKLATNPQGQITWQAQAEAFGTTTPDPHSAITVNLRFPGQYFDEESGLHYNYFRDYDPQIGRYIQSDPIGLKGGINTYAYVEENPVLRIDPLGLVNWQGIFAGIAMIKGVGAGFFYFDLTSECKCGRSVSIKGVASSVAAGIGIKYTGSGSISTFYDHRDCPDPDVANGGFGVIGFSASAVGGGLSCSSVRIGALWSGPSCGGILGIDVSAGIYMGSSIVTEFFVNECCSSKE
ncbi:MAG: RHS repeat-associated core domain-containing protein, partial [Candidatus Contendobacter sp.]